MPPPPKPELFASPQDAQDRADALLDKWNSLINQAVGPSLRGRDDVPKALQKQIISDRARFRTFITRLTFGLFGALDPQEFEEFQKVPTDYATLKKWHAKYELRARQVADALPKGERLVPEAEHEALPRKTTSIENLELASKAARTLALALGVAAGAGLLAALLWSKAKS